MPVRLAAEDLAAALDALLENVFAHTPDGVALRIEVTAGGRLAVEDAGPGFPPGDDAPAGTGLGLDIARRTAAAAGGEARLRTSPLGGARIELDLAPRG